MAAVAAAAAILCIVAAVFTIEALPRLPVSSVLLFAVALLALSLWFRDWEIPLHLIASVLLGAIAWWS
jgi:hypothetical protein